MFVDEVELQRRIDLFVADLKSIGCPKPVDNPDVTAWLKFDQIDVVNGPTPGTVMINFLLVGQSVGTVGPTKYSGGSDEALRLTGIVGYMPAQRTD